MVCPPLPSYETVKVLVIYSIIPASGGAGVPKSSIYPMNRTLTSLDEEPFTLPKLKDGQWIRDGTVRFLPFLTVFFHLIVRSRSSSTDSSKPAVSCPTRSLYLDEAVSVTDRCDSLCAELENKANSRLLQTHFILCVFCAFVDYVSMKFGPKYSFDRLYWKVIGGESLSLEDLKLAKRIFPRSHSFVTTPVLRLDLPVFARCSSAPRR